MSRSEEGTTCRRHLHSIQNTLHGRPLLVVTATLSALQGRNQLTDSPSVAEGTTETRTSIQLQATLCIERALHVTLPSSESAASVTAPVTEGNQGLLAVAFEWIGVAYTTPAVALSHAASASWQYQVALPMPEAGPSSGGELELGPLHLQVRESRQQSKRSLYRLMLQSCGLLLTCWCIEGGEIPASVCTTLWYAAQAP